MFLNSTSWNALKFLSLIDSSFMGQISFRPIIISGDSWDGKMGMHGDYIPQSFCDRRDMRLVLAISGRSGAKGVSLHIPVARWVR